MRYYTSSIDSGDDSFWYFDNNDIDYFDVETWDYWYQEVGVDRESITIDLSGDDTDEDYFSSVVYIEG